MTEAIPQLGGPSEEESLKALLRGEALIHIGQIDQHVSLDPNRLLKLSWLASELAAHLERRL